MVSKFAQAFLAYKELIQTGGIQCTAEGEKVCLNIKGNLAGDILLFIGPANKSVLSGADIFELINSDLGLERQRTLVFNSLKQKYAGLSLLPESLVWITNAGISAFYGYTNSNKIFGLLSGDIDLAGIAYLLPLVFIAVITPFAGRAFGFKMMRPILWLVLQISKLFRQVRNRIAE